MFKFDFSLEGQKDKYDSVVSKIKKRDFYQLHNFYILPYMPEKFRGRVVFLPEKFEPEKIYQKQKHRIEKLEADWKQQESDFVKKLLKFFPKLSEIEITISPSLYGTVGSYWLGENSIRVSPRYDRSITGLQKLVITALVHYYNYDPIDILEKNIEKWKQKQEDAAEIEKAVVKSKNGKSFVKIIDTQFAGKLAQQSADYLERLKASSKFEIKRPEKLTKSEKEVFGLMLRNKNKLVTFDQIADEMWGEKAYEKYSEYAITTLMKKLRKKIKEANNRNLLQAQRGVGYILHS